MWQEVLDPRVRPREDQGTLPVSDHRTSNGGLPSTWYRPTISPSRPSSPTTAPPAIRRVPGPPPWPAGRRQRGNPRVGAAFLFRPSHRALPGPPLLRVLLDCQLTQLTTGRRHGRRHRLLLRIQLREALDRIILRAVSGLLALLAEGVAETDRVRMRAAGGPGAAAVLEEGPHAAGELSGHKVSKRGHHADAC